VQTWTESRKKDEGGLRIVGEMMKSFEIGNSKNYFDVKQ